MYATPTSRGKKCCNQHHKTVVVKRQRKCHTQTFDFEKQKLVVKIGNDISLISELANKEYTYRRHLFYGKMRHNFMRSRY